jgi:hypothetical protein
MRQLPVLHISYDEFEALEAALPPTQRFCRPAETGRGVAPHLYLPVGQVGDWLKITVIDTRPHD